MKNYIISNNKKLEIKNIKKITSDIHLYNYLKLKKKKIEFLKQKTRSRKRYISDYKIVKNKSLRYSKELKVFLNHYHKKKFSDKFWDKVLNEQLYRITLLIYDFYNEFRSTLNKNYISNISKENFQPPNFFHEIFTDFEFGHIYRDQIFKIFIKNFNKNKINKLIKNTKSKFLNDKKIKKQHNRNYVTKLFKNFDLFFLFIENKIKKFFFNPNNTRIAIIKSYFHKKFRLSLENKSNLKISTLNFPSHIAQNTINYKARDSLSKCIKENDKFDLFFKKVISEFFPKILLEDFKINYNNMVDFYSYHANLKYIINESFLSDNWSNLNLAIGKELYNVKHIYNEHNYLNYILFANRVNEFADNVDIYFSIGWKNKKFPLIKKGANLSILPKKSRRYKTYKVLFLPSFSFSRKPYFANYISGDTGFKYYQSSLNFLTNLNKKIKNDLTIKLHPNSFKYLGFEYYYNKIKKYNIVDVRENSQKMMQESELIILDHYSTAFLEVIKLNTPFIIIIDQNFIYLDKLQNSILEELIKNNIIHLSEESASKFLNKIYGKHLDWWNSKKIRNSINKFKKNNFGDELDFMNKLVNMSH